MLSKEEIEKAKERLVKQAITSNADCEDYPNCICMKKDLIVALNYIDQLENKIEAKEKVHEYDIKMIDEVKGEAVKLYNKIDKLNKIIDEMAKWIFDKDYTENSLFIHRDSDYSNCIKQVKQYFEKKVEEK